MVLDRSRATRCAPHATWVRRRLGPLLVLLQALAVVVAVQVSGLAHHLADLVIDADCAADCEDERRSEDGSECPPGCPTCHSCSHAQSLYVARGEAAMDAPAADQPPLSITSTDEPKTDPFRDAVFRPPRA